MEEIIQFLVLTWKMDGWTVQTAAVVSHIVKAHKTLVLNITA